MSDRREADELVDDDGRPVRPCIQCRRPVAFDGQPGEATCETCSVRQYVTAPSVLYPTDRRDGQYD
jgi:hypothetical protein